MDEFIPKPIRIEDLSQKINQFTSQKNEFSIDQLEKLPIYDQTLIDSYRSFSSEGTNDFLRNIINLFLDSTPKLLTQIDGAISTSNETELKHLAHKLKGSVANFGAKRMVMLCEWMERSLNPFHSAKMISRLKKEYEQLQSALSALLTPTVPDKTKPSPPKNQLSV
jgi:HPt (histidine-containing phosphotransfer) domain-containing protein